MKEKGLSLLEATNFEALPGYGIQATVSGKAVVVGTRKLMRERDIAISGFGSCDGKTRGRGENRDADCG